MTNLEMIQKLEQAQELLSDIYHWASTPMMKRLASNGLQITPLSTNAEIESLMSVADGCICEAISALGKE
jgi:hypothetical protein